MRSFLTESDLIPGWAQTAGLERCFIYNGSSMRPTFRPGTLLFVRPASESIARGDVIVFTWSDGMSRVVHRVVAITAQGLVTRGDNNRLVDADPVAPEHIIGRVEIAVKGRRTRSVRNGHVGFVIACVGWQARNTLLWIRRILSWPYALLRSDKPSRLFLALFSRHFVATRLHTPDGPVVKIAFCGRTVARWWPDQKRLVCRKPFDLFIKPPTNSR